MRHLLFAFSLLFSPVALAQQQPPTADGAALPSGKLPDQARPIAYRLDLTIVPDRPRFSGHAEIDIDLRHAASSIFLHGRNLAMHSATIAVVIQCPMSVVSRAILPAAAPDCWPGEGG